MPCIGVTAEDRLSPLQGCSEPFEVPYLSRAARKAPPPQSQQKQQRRRGAVLLEVFLFARGPNSGQKMGLDLRWLPFKRLSARWSNPVYIKAGRKFWVQGTACSECSGPRKRQMPQPLTQCQGQISQLSPDLRSMLGRLNLWLPRNGRFDRGKTGRHLAACLVLVRCRIGLNRPERKHPPP